MKDIKQRLLVIFILLPITLLILYLNIYNYLQILIFSMIMSLIVSYELINLFNKRSLSFNKKIVFAEIIISFSVFFLFYLIKTNNINLFFIKNITFTEIELLLFLIIIISAFNAIIYIFSNDMKKAFIEYIIITFITIFSLLTPILIYNFYMIYSRPFYLFIYFLIIVWSSNSFAYITGMSFKNRHVVGLKCSPNKSYEGYLGGLILGTLCSFLIWKLVLAQFVSIEYLKSNFILKNDFYNIVFIVIINILTMIGDLYESMIKRYCNSKDSSNLFKGHGGILDMVDSIMFVFPFYYFILKLI